MKNMLTLAGRGGDGGGSRAQAIALTPGHHRRGGEGLHTEGPAAPRPSAWPPEGVSKQREYLIEKINDLKNVFFKFIVQKKMIIMSLYFGMHAAYNEENLLY